MTRIARAAAAADEAGLAGLLVAPGPDLLYLTGYTPNEVTERLTLLVVAAGRDPVLVLPGFERPDAEGADVEFLEWSDGQDPYALAADVIGPGRWAVSDACWALHVFPLQEALPDSSFASMTAALPLLRAIKDADELARLAAAGAAADATFADVLTVRSPVVGRSTWPATSRGCCSTTATRAPTSRSSGRARTAPTRTTGRGSA